MVTRAARSAARAAASLLSNACLGNWPQLRHSLGHALALAYVDSLQGTSRPFDNIQLMLRRGRPEIEELGRPFLAVSTKIRDEGRIAVELGGEIEAVSQLLRHGDHVDVDFLMGLGEAGSLLVLAHPSINRLDEGQLLIGRHIAGQLVAPVIDVMEGEWLPVPSLRIDPDHPDFVGDVLERRVSDKLRYGRIL